MIAVSGLLVVIAFVSLILGIFQSGLSLIYVSIASSVLAAVSLATGVVKTRPKTVSVGAGETLGTWGTTATPVSDSPVEEAPPAEEIGYVETPAVTQVLTLDQDEEPAEIEVEAPRPAPRKAAARKTATKAVAKTPAKKTAAKATAKTAAAAGKVVVIPDRDKFHKATCRYAQGEATQTMTKVAAKKAGYVACGVCKP